MTLHYLMRIIETDAISNAFFNSSVFKIENLKLFNFEDSKLYYIQFYRFKIETLQFWTIKMAALISSVYKLL